MNGFTRILLVLLRLAIGWHFFVEGMDKVHSVALGPTETSRPWTSEPYLREATGPVAGMIRQQLGDLDEEALARLTPLPVESGQDPTRLPAKTWMPPALDAWWTAIVDRHATHYELTELQRKDLQDKVDQAREQVVRWLRDGESPVKRPFPSGVVERKMKTPERVRDYQAKLAELQGVLQDQLPAFQKDVAKKRLTDLKADIRRQRTELLYDVDQPLAVALEAVPLTDEQKRRGALPAAPPSTNLARIDFLTRWGLLVVGGCLILGLFTRSACLGGAAFLLMFYLTVPPFPWLPDNPRVEGHYLFVNKNLIELLALLALATTHSGRWLGLDGLLRCLFPWNWGGAKVPAPKPAAA